MRRVLLISSLCLASSCGSSDKNGGDSVGQDDASISAVDASATDARVSNRDSATDSADAGGQATEFPATPIIDVMTPSNAPDLFAGQPAVTPPGDGGVQSGAPCIYEPQDGTLYPSNWLRPRFSWQPTTGQNLFELTLRSEHGSRPLVVYTTAKTWTMTRELWRTLAQRARGAEEPAELTVRGVTLEGAAITPAPPSITRVAFRVAPAAVSGAIVYWTTSGGTALRGFHVGEEGVRDVVLPPVDGDSCVGCHSSTPDGTFVGFSSAPAMGGAGRMGLRASTGGNGEASFLTPTAKTLMARTNQEAPAFSKLHWTASDKIAITMFKLNGHREIVWTDLLGASLDQNSGWGVLARTGDMDEAISASFAHTQDTVIYVSAASERFGQATYDGNLATVPFGARSGGASKLIAGASTTEWSEYYPAFSPDDQLVAFNRVPTGADSYDSPQAELFVIPSAGGTPTRLSANDPPACLNIESPGINNSWPKWSPGVATAGGRTYYWLTFSSKRGPNNKRPQLFVGAVVVAGNVIEHYPAMLLWNQPANESNHTPAWDAFTLPPVF
jgi:hypothetical protein